ncbi:MAG: M16 family metallopeptidase [Pseudohongiellaceae bacterium]
MNKQGTIIGTVEIWAEASLALARRARRVGGGLVLATLAMGMLVACGEPGGGYSRVNVANVDDPLDAHIFELDNGLRVYLTENHQEPRFYAEVAVRAGSKHDPADATGLAHYLEHLLFKGNRNLGTLDYAAEAPHLARIEALYEEHFRTEDAQRRGEIYGEINAEAQLAAQYAVPNEIDKLYNGMGGRGLNAHTWHEETVYKVSLPANRLAQWAAVESDRFINPVFRLFQTELETVYEEKNRSLDSAPRIIGTAVNELLFKVHPYGQQPTIGTVEHLKNPSLVYIQDYFDTWYVPNNMAIFISGDIDIDSTIALIADEFGDWEAKPLPDVGPWDEPPLQNAERATVQYPGQEEVQLAFRTAPNGHADKEALMLLDMILDNRTAGLINLNLNQQQRVLNAGSSPSFFNDAGTQTLYGSPKQNQTLAEVEQLLLDQIELVKAGEFEDWIIPAIINDFKKGVKAGLENNVARVTTMRDAFLTYADWDYHLAEIARMEQITREDVIAVANKYFGDDYVSVYRTNAQHDIPAVEKPPIDPVSIDPTRESAFAAQIQAMSYAPIEPDFVEVDTDYRVVEFAPGVELYYAPNPLNDLFNFSISADVGTEESKQLGLTAALVNVAGTATLDNEALQKEWYRLGSEFNFVAGENRSSFRVSGLDEQFANSLALMLSLINSPTADAEALQQLKGRVLKSRADQRVSPPAISRALYLYNRYGEESPMLEAMSSEEIQAAALDELLALPAQLLGYKQTLTYTGSLPLEELVGILRQHYTPAAELQDTPPYRFRTARQVDANEVLVVDQQTAQAQVRIEFPDDVFDEDDSVSASIYTNYFGGSMSSVVFQELREARALAYSAGAAYLQGNRENAENLMVGVIGTQTDKTVDALDAFIDLMDNLPQSGERFDESVNAQINRYRTEKINFRNVIGAVRSWEQQGLVDDPRRQRFARLQNFSIEDMVRFQQEHLANQPKLISVMGDMSVINAQELARFGTVKEVQIDDIFVD